MIDKTGFVQFFLEKDKLLFVLHPAQRRLLWPSLVSNIPRDIVVGLVLPGVSKEACSGSFLCPVLKWAAWEDCLSSQEQGGELIPAMVVPQNMLSRCCAAQPSPVVSLRQRAGCFDLSCF